MNALTMNIGNTLTQLDWRVINMAKDDPPRSINPDGHFSRFLRDFFGLPVTRKLANESLEALRRFCVRAWHWDFVRIKDVQSLADAGYSSADLRQILAHIAAHRGFTPSIQLQPD